MHGKVVVITGASSGFGKGAALRFAEEGASVVLAARRGDLLEALVRECESRGGQALAVPTDVGEPEEVERLARAAVEKFGRIDVWVNDAGVGALGPFERVPLELHEQVVKTDLLGTLYGSYAAYRQFLEQGAGILINVSSGLGRETVPGYSSYSAAKHGVVGLTETLRQEIEAKGIGGVYVCTVMPGAHDTPFFDHAANYTGREMEPPQPARDPHNVVDAILALARDPGREPVHRPGIATIVTRHGKRGARQPSPGAASEATDTPGAVRAPVPHGTGVSADRR